MPKSGDHISLRDDIDPGRSTSGRNKLSDPSGGQTSFSDYTGQSFGGMYIAGHLDHNHLRTSAVRFGVKFWAEVKVNAMGKHQAKIFDKPTSWDWQILDASNGQVLSNYPIVLTANNGRKTQWGGFHNEPGWGKWIQLRARFKDPGGINNHIPGVTNWITSKTFRYQGAEIPPLEIYTKGEDGYWTGIYTGYGNNNGLFRIKIKWPHDSIYRSGLYDGTKLSYYNVNIYNPSNGHHLGSINVNPDHYGYIYNINAGGSMDGGSATSALRWTVIGYDTKGNQLIPVFGSGHHRQGFKPDNVPIYYSQEQTGTGWAKTWNESTMRHPNL